MTERFTLVEARARIDEAMLRGLSLGMLMLSATGLLIAGLIWLHTEQLETPQKARLGMGLLFALSTLMGLWVARRWGIRTAARYLVAIILLLSFVTAMRTGMGVMSATTALPAAMILIAGFVLGPRAGQITSACSVAGVGLLWLAQSRGWISGATSLNAPPPMTHGLVLMAAFALVGMTVAQYSRLLWRVILTLDAHRSDLEDRVAVQATMQSHLEGSRQRLTALLDHAPLAVVVLDKDSGEMRFANRHALESHGASTLHELHARCVFAEAGHTPQDLLQLVHQARDQGSASQHWPCRTVRGELVWWAMRLELLSLSDTPEVVIFGQDITDNLRQQQALLDHKKDLEQQVMARTSEALLQQLRLEAVIEALPLALTIKDREGRYVLSNRRFEESFGMSKDMLLGYSPEELFPPAMAALFLAHEQALLQDPKMVRYENTILARDGSCKDQLVTKVPLMDAHQRPEAVLTVSVDISEQKALQRELAAAKTEAERLGQVKTDFLANMSHEIRTPLHGMLGMAQVAQHCPGLPEDAHAAIARILSSGRHLMGVIDDILDFSRLDAGKLHVARQAYCPAQLAQEVHDLVQGTAHDKGLSLQLLREPTPPLVLGDPQRTRQILLNLLANAIKFTLSGGVTLQLRIDQNMLCFDVADTGIGMPSETLSRVFSPFEQADSSTSRRFGGTGLGLSISRHLARLQGGDIGVRSSAGQGSTFTLSLPLLLDATTVPSPPLAAPPWWPQESLQGLRILAADDVDINRDILSALLRRRGATITCAENGEDAVKCLTHAGAGHFDLVLMDVQMPVMDGLEATRHLLALDPSLPVLALTAHALPEECARCLAAGMVGHLAKPFDAQEVVSQILQHSRRPVATDTPPTPHAEAVLAQPPAPAGDTAPPTLELDQALSRCGGQEALLRKLLHRFVDQQADFVARHRGAQAADAQAPRELARAVHQFKGTAANLGMPALSACAAALETALRATPSSTPEVLGQAWSALEASLQHHLVAIQMRLGDAVAA